MGNEQGKNKVAIASYEGVLVNQHLGMAENLLIYENYGGRYRLVDDRRTPPRGGGETRWQKLTEVLSDCHTLLVNGIGDTPNNILNGEGITVYEIEGLIEDALDAISRGEVLRMPRRTAGGCRRALSGGGDGEGCA